MSHLDHNLKPGYTQATVDHQGRVDPRISLLDILHIVRRHWLLGISGALVVAITVGLFLVMQPPKYRAESSLVIELATENIIDVEEVLNTSVQNHNMLISFMNTHIQRLTSRSLAERVLNSVDSEIYTRFLEGYVGPLEDLESTIDLTDAVDLIVEKALQVYWGEQSQAIQIIITHSDPIVAQTLANQYVDQYIQYKASVRSKSTGEAVSFLGQEVEELRLNLSEKEMELQKYRKEKNLVTSNRGESIISQKLSQWSDAVTRARVRLSGVESRLEQIRIAGGDLSALMNIPFVGGRSDVKQIYAQLQELRRDFKVLNDTYLSRHPKMLENQASQASVKEALSQAIEQARQEVAVEHQTIVGELKDLEARLAETKEEALQMELDLIDYRMLDRQVERLRKSYDALSTRYSDTTIAERMDLHTVRALDYAITPFKPEWGYRKVAVVVCCLAGVCFFAVPLGFELVDGRLCSFADIESYSGKPLLGDVRYFPKKNLEEMSYAVFRKDQDLLEPFRSIYSSLRLKTDLKQGTLSLVVTSSLPGEGKTFISCNLAATFAMHQFRVLLVDCDLRRPSLHQALRTDNNNGLTAWYASLQAECQMDGVEENQLPRIVPIDTNLALLTAGEASDVPTEILGDPRTSDLFKRLKENFDVVIFDTAPVGLFADATLVADYADACIFVARQFKVSKSKSRYSIGVMDNLKLSVLGVVFNGIKDITAAVGYGNQSSNYYGYGYEKNRKKYHKYYGK
jgi:capsular exopolysaccharide synthesis family protein